MAQFRAGMSCHVCTRPIASDDLKIGFRPFEANRRSPLFPFSDTTVHEQCFERHPLRSGRPSDSE